MRDREGRRGEDGTGGRRQRGKLFNIQLTGRRRQRRHHMAHNLYLETGEVFTSGVSTSTDPNRYQIAYQRLVDQRSYRCRDIAASTTRKTLCTASIQTCHAMGIRDTDSKHR